MQRQLVFNDSNYWDTLSFINTQFGSYIAEDKPIEWAIAKGDITLARTNWNAWNPNQIEDIRLKNFIDLKLDLLEADKNWFQVDSLQLDYLDTLAINKDRAAAYAHSVLDLIGEGHAFIAHNIYELPFNTRGREYSSSC